MKFLNPTHKASESIVRMVSRLSSLNGKQIGLLDNGKKGTSLIFDKLEVILKEKFGVEEIIRERKPDFSRPAPQDVIDKFSGVDAAIAGAGD